MESKYITIVCIWKPIEREKLILKGVHFIDNTNYILGSVISKFKIRNSFIETYIVNLSDMNCSQNINFTEHFLPMQWGLCQNFGEAFLNVSSGLFFWDNDSLPSVDCHHICPFFS